MADRIREIAMQLVRDLRDDGPALPNDREHAALIEAALRNVAAESFNEGVAACEAEATQYSRSRNVDESIGEHQRRSAAQALRSRFRALKRPVPR